MVLVQLTDGRGQEHCAACSPSGHFGASAWSKPQHAQATLQRAERSAALTSVSIRSCSALAVSGSLRASTMKLRREEGECFGCK